jgi:hypothetical protein
VLALFNSKAVNWWFVKRYGVLMEVGGFKVGSIPMPLGWARSKAQLAKLANELGELLPRKSKSRTPHEITRLARQIEVARTSIDRLVFEMYRLSDEDISLIEVAHDRWTAGKPADVTEGAGEEDEAQARL